MHPLERAAFLGRRLRRRRSSTANTLGRLDGCVARPATANAYPWTEMLVDDTYGCCRNMAGMIRANGDRFRNMALSRGNTEDLGKMYAARRGRAGSI